MLTLVAPQIPCKGCGETPASYNMTADAFFCCDCFRAQMEKNNARLEAMRHEEHHAKRRKKLAGEVSIAERELF